MKKDINYDEVLNRMGYFMNKANLSSRATSLSLGYSEQFMKRILNGSVELKVSTLLEFFALVGISAQDFFYLGTEYDENDKHMLDMFNNLSKESKEVVVSVMKQLK